MASEYEPTDQHDDHQQDTGQPDTSAEAPEQRSRHRGRDRGARERRSAGASDPHPQDRRQDGQHHEGGQGDHREGGHGQDGQGGQGHRRRRYRPCQGGEGDPHDEEGGRQEGGPRAYRCARRGDPPDGRPGTRARERPDRWRSDRDRAGRPGQAGSPPVRAPGRGAVDLRERVARRHRRKPRGRGGAALRPARGTDGPVDRRARRGRRDRRSADRVRGYRGHGRHPRGSRGAGRGRIRTVVPGPDAPQPAPSASLGTVRRTGPRQPGPRGRGVAGGRHDHGADPGRRDLRRDLRRGRRGRRRARAVAAVAAARAAAAGRPPPPRPSRPTRPARATRRRRTGSPTRARRPTVVARPTASRATTPRAARRAAGGPAGVAAAAAATPRPTSPA